VVVDRFAMLRVDFLIEGKDGAFSYGFLSGSVRFYLLEIIDYSGCHFFILSRFLCLNKLRINIRNHIPLL
jgi:hypothetical protein